MHQCLHNAFVSISEKYTLSKRLLKKKKKKKKERKEKKKKEKKKRKEEEERRRETDRHTPLEENTINR